MSDAPNSGSSPSTGLFRADGLGRKAGPFPLWVWGLIVVGLGLVMFMWLRNQSGGTTDVSEATGTGSDAGEGTDLTSGDLSSSSDTTIGTNSDWLTAALNDLGPSVANQQALQDYLNGGQISSSDESVVDQALSAIGAPPQGTATPISVAPASSTGSYALNSTNFTVNPTIVSKGVVSGFTVVNKQTGKQIAVTSQSLGGANANDAYNSILNELTGSTKTTTQTATGAINNQLKSLGAV